MQFCFQMLSRFGNKNSPIVWLTQGILIDYDSFLTQSIVLSYFFQWLDNWFGADHPPPRLSINHVPNNVIGRAGSVFNSLNIMVRMCLIGLFALPFFTTNDNVRYAYLVGAIMVLMAIIPLILHYKSLINLDKKQED